MRSGTCTSPRCLVLEQMPASCVGTATSTLLRQLIAGVCGRLLLSPYSVVLRDLFSCRLSWRTVCERDGTACLAFLGRGLEHPRGLVLSGAWSTSWSPHDDVGDRRLLVASLDFTHSALGGVHALLSFSLVSSATFCCCAPRRLISPPPPPPASFVGWRTCTHAPAEDLGVPRDCVLHRCLLIEGGRDSGLTRGRRP